jgi:hypothetical protein
MPLIGIGYHIDYADYIGNIGYTCNIGHTGYTCNISATIAVFITPVGTGF